MPVEYLPLARLWKNPGVGTKRGSNAESESRFAPGLSHGNSTAQHVREADSNAPLPEMRLRH
jgi:hypothetical protein